MDEVSCEPWEYDELFNKKIVWVLVRYRGGLLMIGGVFASYELAARRLRVTLAYDTEDGSWKQDGENIYKWWRGPEWEEIVEQTFFCE